MNEDFWVGKNVFVTGHTGFKGGWISHWLSDLGALVHGYSQDPFGLPNLFEVIRLRDRITSSTIGDICDQSTLKSAMQVAQPDIVIHMAAQPLVRLSYRIPLETFSTNVIGTLSVIEAARSVGSVKAIINVTTDKCYENKEWIWPYREDDRLGGRDPYSASKACAEMASLAYRDSFLNGDQISLANVRAGNVIGGGDWAADRLIPDFLRAADERRSLVIRSPESIRPWQHVLEPLSGYLILAERLYENGNEFAEAWNFGPDDTDAKPVSWIADQLCQFCPSVSWETDSSTQPHESGLLKLDSSKAKSKLDWTPRWTLNTAIHKTLEWHQAWKQNENMAHLTSLQIRSFVAS